MYHVFKLSQFLCVDWILRLHICFYTLMCCINTLVLHFVQKVATMRLLKSNLYLYCQSATVCRKDVWIFFKFYPDSAFLTTLPSIFNHQGVFSSTFWHIHELQFVGFYEFHCRSFIFKLSSLCIFSINIYIVFFYRCDVVLLLLIYFYSKF